MNERQSIEESIELWEVLAANGSLKKKDVPGPWQYYQALCPLCQFAGRTCSACPVFFNEDFPMHCMDNGSPFVEWLNALTYVGKAKAASKMVKLFRRALKNV